MKKHEKLLSCLIFLVLSSIALTSVAALREGIVVKVKESKNKGIVAVVVGKLREVDLASTYEATVIFNGSSPASVISDVQSGVVDAMNPIYSVADETFQFNIVLDLDEATVTATYKRYDVHKEESQAGVVGFAENGINVMNSSGEATLRPEPLTPPGF